MNLSFVDRAKTVVNAKLHIKYLSEFGSQCMYSCQSPLIESKQKPLECVQPYFNPLHKRFVYNGNDFVGPIPKCKSEILKLYRKEIRGHGNVVRYSTE